MLQYFRRLGDAIEADWKRREYDENAFGSLCVSALEHDSPIGKVAPEEVLTWVRTAPSILPQIDIEARFGSPPVTVYRGPRFYISVLFWVDGSTSIHQHSFSGAFQVLEGTSIHIRHRFETDRVVSPRLRLGLLHVDEIELLRTGDVRRIDSGAAFIHAHFHLDRPTTTLVIRTDEDPSTRPQFDYTPPGIGVDPFFAEGHMNRKIQTASLLLATQKSRAFPAIEEMLTCSDLLTTFRVLSAVRNHIGSQGFGALFGSTVDEERFAHMLDVARQAHGSAIDVWSASLTATQQRMRLMNARRSVEDVDQRFLLAAVMNLPNRRDVLKLVESRHPGCRAPELVADWTDGLVRTRVGRSNPIGVNVDDLGIQAFQLMVDGRSLADVRRCLRGQGTGLSDDELARAVNNVRDQFAASALAPLVADSH